MQKVPQLVRWEQALGRCHRVGLDTNAVIYAIENVEPYAELALRLLSFVESGRIIAVVSPIVEAEALVKPLRRRDFRLVQRIEMFFSRFPNLRVREVDRRIARRAAEIRAATLWTLPDAIIVATALEDRCDAMVGNDRKLASAVTGTPYLYMENYVE
ncbi:MAG: PIN domain-containing protein [Chloroflexi bacterium]|nr:PIN domain-containing protein [Chloroflexota bacterium]